MPAASPDPESVRLAPVAHTEITSFCESHKTRVLTILLSDLEGSTRMQSELGNARSMELVSLHRRIFREVLGGHDGQEISTEGDSFLAVFAAPSDGVLFALRLQAAMRKAQQDEPQLPLARVGLHQGQVMVDATMTPGGTEGIHGLQVSTTARIADMGKGGQILCSRAVFDDARAILKSADVKGLGEVVWRNHGPYRFKGVEDAYEVCEVGERGLAPLAAPEAGSKGRPADMAEEELGWRPAPGGVIPGTSWVLEERLGREERAGSRPAFRGEFGEVWRARNPADGSVRVFKFCFRKDQIPALKREARILRRLAELPHPNLVHLHDVSAGEEPPYYLSMECVDGPSLEEWLAEEPELHARLEVMPRSRTCSSWCIRRASATAT